LKKLFSACSITLLAFLLATNIYRAWTQSITVDEAHAYQTFMKEGLWHAIAPPYFDAAHHCLQTILAKISISLFGVSEFTLRLPTLLGSILYFLAAYRLAKHLFGENLMGLLLLATLTLNPYILDFLSAARGYGLALSFLLWGFERMLVALETLDASMAFRAAVGLSLSVASNLVFAFPCLILGALFITILLVDGWRSKDIEQRRGVWFLGIDRFATPGIVLMGLFMALPFRYAQRGNFYAGIRSPFTSIQSILDMSLQHASRVWKWFGREFSFRSVLEVAIWYTLPVLLAISAVACVWLGVRWLRGKSYRDLNHVDRMLFLLTATSVGAFVLVVASVRFLGAPYPFGRTGIYWVPLAVLVCFALLKKLVDQAGALRWLAVPGFLFFCLIVFRFAVLFQTYCYIEWILSARSRDVIRLIETRHKQSPQQKVTLGVEWYYASTLEFYRERFHFDWMNPVERRLDDPKPGADYYVIQRHNSQLLAKLNLKPILDDLMSGTILAVPQ